MKRAYISNTVIGLNTGVQWGGGVAIHYDAGGMKEPDVTLNRVEVTGNTVTASPILPGEGGGVWSNAVLTLTGGTDIHDNRAFGLEGKLSTGGGFYAFDGTLNLWGVRLGDNLAAIGDGAARKKNMMYDDWKGTGLTIYGKSEFVLVDVE